MVTEGERFDRILDDVSEYFLSDVHVGAHDIHGLGAQFARILQDFHRNADFSQVMKHGTADDLVAFLLVHPHAFRQFGADGRGGDGMGNRVAASEINGEDEHL